MFLKTFCLAILLAGVSAKDTQDDTSSFKEKPDSYCDSEEGCVGSPNAINYTAIEEYIDKKVAERTLEYQISALHLTSSLRTELRATTACLAFGTVYNGICYYLVIDQSRRLVIDYFDAKTLCQESGSTLGDILSETHYDRLISHVRARKHDSYLTFINFWTGMKRDMLTGKVYLSDGSPAPYVGPVRSAREWSTTDVRRPYIYVSVWTDGVPHDSNPGGFGNAHASQMWNAALCQFHIRTGKNEYEFLQ